MDPVIECRGRFTVAMVLATSASDELMARAADEHARHRRSAADRLGVGAAGDRMPSHGHLAQPAIGVDALGAAIGRGISSGLEGIVIVGAEGEQPQTKRAQSRGRFDDERPDLCGVAEAIGAGGGVICLRAERLDAEIASLVDLVATVLGAHVDAAIVAGRVGSGTPSLRVGDHVARFEAGTTEYQSWPVGSGPDVVGDGTRPALLLRISTSLADRLGLLVDMAPFWPALRLGLPRDVAQPTAVYGFEHEISPADVVTSTIEQMDAALTPDLVAAIGLATACPANSPDDARHLLRSVGRDERLTGNFVGSPLIRRHPDSDLLAMFVASEMFVLRPDVLDAVLTLVGGEPVTLGELVDSVRGVDVTRAIDHLRARGLVRVAGEC